MTPTEKKMIVLAIDPGAVESAFVVWDGLSIFGFGKIPNQKIFDKLLHYKYDVCVIEQISSYGMSVGESVFETVFWSGRFAEASFKPFERIKRMEVKMRICHDSRAKDSNIITALIDRFAPNTPNRGKGTKKSPGFFYGFKKDIWQAFALAVTYLDNHGI